MAAQAGTTPGRLQEIALDTSALSNLCADVADPASALIAAVRRRNARLVLLPETLVESFVGKVEYSRPRAGVLAEVEAALAGRCGIAVTLDKIWRREAKGHRLGGTPVYANARIAGLVREDGAYDRIHAEHAAKMTDEISAMHDRAAALEGQAEQRFIGDTTKQERRNRADLLADFAGERALCRGPLSKLLDGTREDAATLLSDPIRVELNRARVLASGLAAANGLRALLHSHHTPEAEWLKRDPGNWTDARIAANAAYCDYLVTDDESLYACLEFLRAAGFDAPEPLRLGEFLSKAVL